MIGQNLWLNATKIYQNSKKRYLQKHKSYQLTKRPRLKSSEKNSSKQ